MDIVTDITLCLYQRPAGESQSSLSQIAIFYCILFVACAEENSMATVLWVVYLYIIFACGQSDYVSPGHVCIQLRGHVYVHH